MNWLHFKVMSFRARGLEVASVTGGSTHNDEVMRKIVDGAYQLVLFTPEMLLQSRRWRDMLSNEVYTTNLKALVVDEAHTVKKW